MNANEWIITFKLLKKLQSTASFLWNLFGRTLPKRDSTDKHMIWYLTFIRWRLLQQVEPNRHTRGHAKFPLHAVLFITTRATLCSTEVALSAAREQRGTRALKRSTKQEEVGKISNDVMKGRLQSSDVWNHQHQTVKISKKANRGIVSQQEALRRQPGNKSVLQQSVQHQHFCTCPATDHSLMNLCSVWGFALILRTA